MDPKWSQLGQYGGKWAPHGPKWQRTCTTVAPSGATRPPQRASCGPNVGSNWPDSPQMNPCGANVVPNGPKCGPQLDPSGPCGPKINHHGAPKAPHGSAKRCPPPKAARSAAPSDRPKSAEHRRRDRRAGKARDTHEPAGTRMSPARLRQVRVDGNNPQG